MPFLGKFPTQIVDPEVDIDGGAIDGVTIGATTASAATVTTLTSGNITTTGYIAGPSTFTIDPAAVGDNTGTLVIAGNLQVDGTTTTINSTTMTVDDLNITLASGAANAAAANGAGITVDGASASLTYYSTGDAWAFNKRVGIGQVNPQGALHVVQTEASVGETDPLVRFERFTTGDNHYLDITLDNDNNLVGFQSTGTSNGGFTFGGASTELMRINSSGNVGIGEDTPNALLHLGAASPHIDLGASGSNRGKVGYNNSHVYIGTTSSVGSIYFKNNISSTDAPWSSGDTKMIVGDGGVTAFQTLTTSLAGNTKHLVLNNTGATQWEFYSYNDGNLYINALPSGGSTATRFTITDSGEVGVGTASPGQLGTSFNNQFVVSTANSSGYANITAQGATGSAGGIDMWGGSIRHAGIYSANGSDLLFYTNGSNSGTTLTSRMSINSDGSVLIGGTNNTFSSKVSVAGSLTVGEGISSTSIYFDDATASTSRYRLTNSLIVEGDFAIMKYNGSSWDDALYIDENRRIGIGTDNPAGPLHIQSATNRTIVLDCTQATGSFTWASVRRSGSEKFRWFINSNDSMSLYSDVGSLYSMTWLTNGKVGIGTTSPEEKLHLYHGTKNVTPLKIEGYLSTTNGSTMDSYQEVKFVAGGSDQNPAGIRHHANVWSDGNSALSFLTSQHGGSYAERMRILPSGGITFNGDTAAANALDDYEEGTWTPVANYHTTVTDTSTTNATINGSGWYRKIGSQVTVYAEFQSSSTANYVYKFISGLPFTANGSNLGTLYVRGGRMRYGANTRTDCYFYSSASSTTAGLSAEEIGSTGFSGWVEVLGTSQYVKIQITYKVN